MAGALVFQGLWASRGLSRRGFGTPSHLGRPGLGSASCVWFVALRGTNCVLDPLSLWALSEPSVPDGGATVWPHAGGGGAPRTGKTEGAIATNLLLRDPARPFQETPYTFPSLLYCPFLPVFTLTHESRRKGLIPGLRAKWGGRSRTRARPPRGLPEGLAKTGTGSRHHRFQQRPGPAGTSDFLSPRPSVGPRDALARPD
jgi:hypothetical protein